LKTFIFENEMEKVENFRLKFEKKVISPEGNEEIIYFVYAIEIKLSIISLYHLCIPPYTTWASCGGIQISAVGSFPTDPFPIVV
jgi:hypothetical protein